MANTITAFLERLTGAAGEYNQAKVGRLSFIDAVYLDVRPEVARAGQTIRIYFPDIGAFTDQAGNDWAPADINPGYVDVAFGERPGYAILIRDFEQFQTATSIIQQYLDPMYKRAMEYANGRVAAQITTTNFPVYPPIQGATGTIGIADAKLAWNVLIKNKVPIRDANDAALIYHSDIHSNMLTDTNWYQESLVGAMIAAGTRQQAAEPGTGSNIAFNFRRLYDQQAVTTNTANLTGTVAVTNGSTTVTGTGTTFTTQAPVGAWVTITTDGVSYPVAAVTSNTSLTLAQPYQGTTGTGLTYVRTTYTSVAMHKFAIALAVRPLEIVNDGHIHGRLLMLRGLPIRVTLSWQHLKSGWLLSADYGMVAKVIRPDFGVLIQS